VSARPSIRLLSGGNRKSRLLFKLVRHHSDRDDLARETGTNTKDSVKIVDIKQMSRKRVGTVQRYLTNETPGNRVIFFSKRDK